jgi:TPR repeat protein
MHIQTIGGHFSTVNRSCCQLRVTRQMSGLGALYANGRGVAQDYAKARELVREGR